MARVLEEQDEDKIDDKLISDIVHPVLTLSSDNNNLLKRNADGLDNTRLTKKIRTEDNDTRLTKKIRIEDDLNDSAGSTSSLKQLLSNRTKIKIISWRRNTKSLTDQIAMDN